MDEEGASTLYLSDVGGELAGDYIVEAMRGRPLLALMTHVMAAWRGRAHQVIRRVLISTFVGIASASFTSMPDDMAYAALPRAAWACATIS